MEWAGNAAARVVGAGAHNQLAHAADIGERIRERCDGDREDECRATGVREFGVDV